MLLERVAVRHDNQRGRVRRWSVKRGSGSCGASLHPRAAAPCLWRRGGPRPPTRVGPASVLPRVPRWAANRRPRTIAFVGKGITRAGGAARVLAVERDRATAPRGAAEITR